ncbi:MAG: hypothetical protein KDE22_06660 [Rhodobacterales bacterium]|nr:hypothetical protein [Rhodobacterales bacterium]
MTTDRRTGWTIAALVVANLAAAHLAVMGAAGPARAEGMPKLSGPQDPGGAANLPTVREFEELCRSTNAVLRATCGRYVNATIDVHTSIGERYGAFRVICPSRPLNDEQARRVFLSWYDRHVGAAERPLAPTVVEALAERYPCAKYLK